MNNKNRFIDNLNRVPWCIVCNLLMVYFAYIVSRLVFLLENLDMFQATLTWPLFWRIMRGGLMFDTSAIFYTNILYLLLVLLPLHYKERPRISIITKWVFVVINSVAVLTNLIDAIYFPFSEKRTTMLIYDEFSSNTNGATIVGIELVNHWYLVVLFVLIVLMFIYGYRNAKWPQPIKLKKYYIKQSIWLVIFGLLAVAGIRGAFFHKSSRPIAMSNAHQYVEKPKQAAIVLNTPFSIIRTLMKSTVHVPKFFDDEQKLAKYYSAVHMPNADKAPDKRNVVIFIVESFAEEFIGSRNRDLDNGTYKGYTPFTDSLLTQSTTFEHTYANGWISIDAMPSVLSSVPKMYTPFILTPYALDDVPGLAKELRDWGYHTAFFHGAENSSMGFQAYARSAGFQEYLGRTEYYADSRFGGEKDYDGTWAIWDEEFLQYMCVKLSEMPQPFMASVFTATSHHPFALPERYKDVFPEEGTYPIHKCVRYTDYSLRRFFDEAKKQPWYNNTIFVITADHASSRVTHDLYRTAEGDFRIPIIIFDPSGGIEPGTRKGIAQQIDIMPTVLSLLGYDKPYVAFGKDMLNTSANDSWAFNWHNVPQYIKGDWMIQYNDFNITGIYHLPTDRLMQNNLIGTSDYDREFINEMVFELQAILQDVDHRMKSNTMRDTSK